MLMLLLLLKLIISLGLVTIIHIITIVHIIETFILFIYGLTDFVFDIIHSLEQISIIICWSLL